MLQKVHRSESHLRPKGSHSPSPPSPGSPALSPSPLSPSRSSHRPDTTHNPLHRFIERRRRRSRNPPTRGIFRPNAHHSFAHMRKSTSEWDKRPWPWSFAFLKPRDWPFLTPPRTSRVFQIFYVTAGLPSTSPPYFFLVAPPSFFGFLKTA